MAIAHFSVSIVSRGDGRSAVLSAAYRHCARMEYEREARTVDYTRKQGLLHEEFVLPVDAPKWARMLIADRSIAGASETFWNKVEAFEKRSDAQLAKDLTIALPLELTPEQNIALVRDFVERHILSKGMVADWVYHDNPGNPHIHLMTTLRLLTEDGFVEKLIAEGGTLDQLVALGATLEAIQPQLRQLSATVPELHESVDALNRAVEPLSGLATRLPGGRKRTAIEA